MITLTRPQRLALQSIYRDSEINQPNTVLPYLAFRRLVRPSIDRTAVLVPTPSIWIDIDPDGTTHT